MHELPGSGEQGPREHGRGGRRRNNGDGYILRAPLTRGRSLDAGKDDDQKQDRPSVPSPGSHGAHPGVNRLASSPGLS